MHGPPFSSSGFLRADFGPLGLAPGLGVADAEGVVAELPDGEAGEAGGVCAGEKGALSCH